MQSHKDQLKTLKKMLVSENNFSSTFTYFFDHFGQNQSFLDCNKKVKNTLLKKIMKAMGKQIFQKDVEISHLMLMKFPKTKFIHGACLIQSSMTTVFFFGDIDTGMACVYHPNTSNEVQYVRFTSRIIESDKAIIQTSEASKFFH